MSVVEIAYHPDDFYYKTSVMYSENQSVCPTWLKEDTQPTYEKMCCTDILDKKQCENWDKNTEKCYILELCKNKKYADLANKLDNNNSGANERQRNFRKQFQNEVLKTINISVSILIITYSSVYFFKT